MFTSMGNWPPETNWKNYSGIPIKNSCYRDKLIVYVPRVATTPGWVHFSYHPNHWRKFIPQLHGFGISQFCFRFSIQFCIQCMLMLLQGQKCQHSLCRCCCRVKTYKETLDCTGAFGISEDCSVKTQLTRIISVVTVPWITHCRWSVPHDQVLSGLVEISGECMMMVILWVMLVDDNDSTSDVGRWHWFYEWCW